MAFFTVSRELELTIFILSSRSRYAAIIVPRRYFINVVAWRQTAEFVTRYFRKGKPILVCGALQSRSYTDNQGNKRYVTEVVADEVGFVENKSDSAAGGASYTPDAYAAPSYSNTDTAAPKFEAVSEEDDLPF